MNGKFGGINYFLKDYYESITNHEQRTTNYEPIYAKQTQFSSTNPEPNVVHGQPPTYDIRNTRYEIMQNEPNLQNNEHKYDISKGLQKYSPLNTLQARSLPAVRLAGNTKKCDEKMQNKPNLRTSSHKCLRSKDLQKYLHPALLVSTNNQQPACAQGIIDNQLKGPPATEKFYIRKKE